MGIDYAELVKTTITLPDALVRKAERAARKMGMSRNQFFVLAILEYFEWRAEDKITRQLNRIYSQEIQT